MESTGELLPDNATADNHNSSLCRSWLPDTKLEKVAKHCAFTLLCVFGILFNVFIIFIISKKIKLRKHFHYLIINMSVSDVMFCVSHLLFYIPELSDRKLSVMRTGMAGLIICKVLRFVHHSSHKVSVLTLLVISIQRYRATKRKLRRPYTVKQGVAVICVTWLISISVSMFYAISAKVVQNGPECSAENSKSVYVFLFAWLTLMIACISIMILSCLAMRRLSSHQAMKNHPHHCTSQTNRIRAAIKMVITSAVVFICCRLPSLFSGSVRYFEEALEWKIGMEDHATCFDWRSYHYMLFKFLPVFNSFLSPIVYMCFLSDLKQAAGRILKSNNSVDSQSHNGNHIELRPPVRVNNQCFK